MIGQPLDIVELTSIREVRVFHDLDVRNSIHPELGVGLVLINKRTGQPVSVWIDPEFSAVALLRRLRDTFPIKTCPWHGSPMRRNANPQDCTCAAVLASRIDAALRVATVEEIK